MAQKVKIVTDSTSDIPDALAEELDIGIIYDYINFGTTSLRDKVDISRPEFYRRLTTETETPTTASPGVGEFEQAYRRAGAPNVQVVSMHPPARLSALFNAAHLAAQGFPEGHIAVVDTGQLSMGMGWLVVAAARAARAGAAVDEIVELVKGVKSRVRLYAALDTFEFLRRSGRVGWARALVGTLLRIKPMISVRDGDVLALDRVRTTRRALERLTALASDLGAVESLALLHTNWPAGADQLGQKLAHLSVKEPLLTVDVTPVIGVHVGPKAVGLAAVVAD